MNRMDQYIWEFARWIRLTYGRTGCAVAFLIMVSLLALAFFLLSRLPEPKEIIVWSKCSSCKYKCNKSNVLVLACPKHEMPRLFDFKLPPCPRQHSFAGCDIIENQSSPAILRRDSLPEIMGVL